MPPETMPQIPATDPRKIKLLKVTPDALIAHLKGDPLQLFRLRHNPLPADATVVGATFDWQGDAHLRIHSETFPSTNILDTVEYLQSPVLQRLNLDALEKR